MLMMGTIYSWSVFRVEVELIFKVNTTLSGFPYMVSLFCYAFAVMIAGKFLTEKRIKRIAIIGSCLIGFGWVLSSTTMNIFLLTTFYGILIGTGVGTLYVTLIFLIQRIVTKNTGLYTGIVILGFGISPLITAPISNDLISTYDLPTTFLILGIFFLIFLVISSNFLNINERENLKTINKTNSDKPKDYRFYIIYGLFFIATTIGLMMIGLSYSIGVDNYNFKPNQVTFLLSLFALANGISRPIFGAIIDKKGFLTTTKLSYALITIAAILAIINQGRSLLIFSISFGLFWFNLGAWLSIVPIVTKQYYGMNNYARNFGKIFSAYGFGAVFGVLLSGSILDVFHNTTILYLSIIIMTSITLLLLFLFPKKLFN